MWAGGRKLIIGCGYLGRRVAAAWSAQGSRVSVLTRSAENARAFSDLGWDPIVGDVTDPATLTALPEVETVLYAVGFDRNSGKSLRQVYVDGLQSALNRIAGRAERFLHVSSTSVYGQDAGEWVDETSTCQPATPNGQVCLEAEELVRTLFRPREGMPGGSPAQRSGATELRLAGIYGPGRLIARLEAIREGEPLRGNPEAWLNLIHVDDAVAAILACEQRGMPGETCLVCDDQPTRRIDYYTMLAKLAGLQPPSAGTDLLPSLNKRCCNRKLHEQLRVELKYPTIAEGLPHALLP